MKKRGDISLWFLVEVVGAFLVVYLAINVASTYSKGTVYEKLNLAKDIAMQINTLSSIPGDAYIINKNFHGYSLRIIDNKVEVFEDSNELAKGIYYFVKSGNYNLNILLQKPEQVVVSKIGNEIKISKIFLDQNESLS